MIISALAGRDAFESLMALIPVALAGREAVESLVLFFVALAGRDAFESLVRRSPSRWPDEGRLSRWWCVLALFSGALTG